MQFEFATAGRIIFGPGAVAQLGSIAKALGRRVLFVTGRSAERVERIRASLASQVLNLIPFQVGSEPTVDLIAAGAGLAKEQGCDLVLSVGGGSVIDAGKAIAACLTNEGELLDYLEVIGQGKPLVRSPAPFVAVPTTAGTGAEVTRNAVLASTRHHVKVSLRSSLMLAKVALVDPELTCNLPAALTASTGLDALTQVIEPYVSNRANPMTDPVCIEGMRRTAVSLRRACENGDDQEAREDMALASLFGGLALANAGLGAVHGFAAPLGGMFHAPHGAVCAALLPHATEINIRALRERQPHAQALRRYQEMARILTGRPQASAEDGVRWLRELCSALQTASLGDYGVAKAHIPELVDKAGKASSMRSNPIQLTADEMREILMSAL
ncbi:MAG: iron-containing alcohol dehydrogenase [Verrucomicrobia bacterium]|nr:iron-containing alcohol dehydrogenase [Verrucomicrobiota bacterium]